MESAHSAYFNVSLNVPQITESKLKTMIIIPDRKFMYGCCQALYMLLMCSRLEEVIGYNRAQ